MRRETERETGKGKRERTLPFPAWLARLLRRIIGAPDYQAYLERRLRLVDWFNRVDATYRTELRELNELNFGRFDAKLEALESRLEARMAAFEARIIRWMFLFWVGQAVTTIGLVFGAVRLTGR